MKHFKEFKMNEANSKLNWKGLKCDEDDWGMGAEEYADYLSKIKVEGATVTDINGVLSNDTGEVWFTVLMSNTDEITFEMDKRGKPNFSITFLSLDYMRQQKFDKEFKKLYDKSLDPIYAGMGVYVNTRPKMS